MTSKTPLAALAAALILPASASAATLGFTTPCAYSGSTIGLVGHGFTLNGPVNFTGFDTATLNADGTGSVFATLGAPVVKGFGTKDVILTATDATNPAVTARAKIPVVRGQRISNAPLTGRPTQRVIWKFAGFTGGKPIYGHFRFGGKVVKTVKYGTAKGPCGTLKSRSRRLPTRTRLGAWELVLDQQRKYSASNPDKSVLAFTIYRKFGS